MLVPVIVPFSILVLIQYYTKSIQRNTSGPTGRRWGTKVGPAAGGLAGGAGGPVVFLHTPLCAGVMYNVVE